MEIRAKESGKLCATCGKSGLTAEAFENDNAKDMNDDNGSASAIVPIRVMNTRGYRLPKTGDAGTTLLAAGGMGPRRAQCRSGYFASGFQKKRQV